MTQTIPVNPLSGLSLDRCGRERTDPSWVRKRLTAAASRIIPIWRDQSLLRKQDDGMRLAAVQAAAFLAAGAIDEPIFLGMDDQGPWFATDISVLDDPVGDPRLRRIMTGGTAFTDLRQAARLLPAEEASLGAYARGMVYWHRRHLFCGVCGSPTESLDGGHKRRCTNTACGATHFPRTDPAMIVLVHDGDRCLLGRSPRFPPAMYSAIAGFVEPGESLEDCVRREVLEETGISVGDIRYHSSQPWPFPASLMVGFTAKAESIEIETDGDEIEDAFWIDRQALLAEIDQGENAAIRLPPRLSIARRLITDWLGS